VPANLSALADSLRGVTSARVRNKSDERLVRAELVHLGKIVFHAVSLLCKEAADRIVQAIIGNPVHR